MTIERSEPFVRYQPRNAAGAPPCAAYPGRIEKLNLVLVLASILLGAAGMLWAVFGA